MTQERYLHVEVSVSTRVFGYSIPCTAMIPMADMLNHADVDVQYEVFNKRLHLGDKQSGNYYTRSKYMNDFAFMYTLEEIEKLCQADRFLLNIKGRFNSENFAKNMERYWDSRSF